MCECDLMCGWRKGKFHPKRCKPNRAEKCRSIYLECRKCNLEFFVCTSNNMARLCPCFFTKKFCQSFNQRRHFFQLQFFSDHICSGNIPSDFSILFSFEFFLLEFFPYIFPIFSIKLFFPRFFPFVKRVNFICEERISNVFFLSKLKTLWKIGHRLMIAHVQNILHLFCSTKFVNAEKRTQIHEFVNYQRLLK